MYNILETLFFLGWEAQRDLKRSTTLSNWEKLHHLDTSTCQFDMDRHGQKGEISEANFHGPGLTFGSV